MDGQRQSHRIFFKVKCPVGMLALTELTASIIYILVKVKALAGGML